MKAGYAVAFATVLSCLSSAAIARDDIRIVGSSTVFPFTSAVVERLAATGIKVDLKSTGTRAGFSAFCLGYGDWWPDVTGASRPMTTAERQSCLRRGVKDITEIRIGYDGIVVARGSGASAMNLTRQDLYKALARKVAVNGSLVGNPHTTWRSVNSDLANIEIVVFGPPGSSGTRDSFENLAISAGCAQVSKGTSLPDDLSDLETCRAIRSAPHYVEAGEDDSLIVQALRQNPDALGIFGYSYAVTNPDAIRAMSVDGVMPSRDTIADGSYPLSRPLFIYVKDNRIAAVPALKTFLDEYLSDAALGPQGYLAKIGLVTQDAAALKETRSKARHLIATSPPSE